MSRAHQIAQFGLAEAGVDAEEQDLAERTPAALGDRELEALPAHPALTGALEVGDARLSVERRRHRGPAGDVRVVQKVDQVVEIFRPPIAQDDAVARQREREGKTAGGHHLILPE